MEARRERSRLPWPLLVLAILSVNAPAIGWIVWAKARPWAVASGGSSRSHYRDLEYLDGTVREIHEDLTASVVLSDTVVRPPTGPGLALLWGPAGASVVLTLAVLAMASTEGGRKALRTLKRPRLTMFHGMVAVGAISVWLWLSRIGWVVLL